MSRSIDAILFVAINQPKCAIKYQQMAHLRHLSSKIKKVMHEVFDKFQ